MATELGKAYVQIVPSAQGIEGSITNLLGGESESAGKISGGKLMGALRGVIVAAGVGKVLKDSLLAGADIQQSLGGIETLYKGSAEKMKGYANAAFETTGMSANSYMETVTSFSAGLIASMGGDTDAAAQVANRAMIDMSDNANKMGTDMASIENAYQGFAKQNYTMLDNLKLGYGGTQQEMQRLLADATELSGVEYDITNLSDVYTAIGVIQDNLGITGTTALEAAETFTGSFNAMKASAENVLAGLTTGYNLGPALESLATTAATFLFGNLLPMIVNFAAQLPGAIMTFLQVAVPLFLQKGGEFITNLITGITTGLPGFIQTASTMITSFISTIATNLPQFLAKGREFISNLASGFLQALPGQVSSVGSSLISNFTTILSNLLNLLAQHMPKILTKGLEMIKNLVEGIARNAPKVFDSMLNILQKLLTTIVQKMPEFLRKGVDMITKIATGIANNLPAILTAIGRVLSNLISTLAKHLPQLMQKGVEFSLKIAAGLIQALPSILSSVAKIGAGILRGIVGFMGQMVSAGRDLLLGLGRGIAGAVGSVINQAVQAAKRIVGSVKSFFGIRSPSRVFMEIGKFLDEGLAEGISDNLKPIDKAMQEVENTATRSFESEFSVNGHSRLMSGSLENGSTTQQNRLDAIVQLVQKLVDKDPNLYIDKDTLISEIIDDVDKALADRSIGQRWAVGGV